MFAACITVSLASFIAGIAALFITRRIRLHSIQLGLNVLVVVPMIVLLMMRASGSSPTRQFNATSDPSMDWWSLWFNFWPAAMFLLLGAILATLTCLVITAVSVVRIRPRHHVTVRLLHALLGFAQSVLMLLLIGQNYPDA